MANTTMEVDEDASSFECNNCEISNTVAADNGALVYCLDRNRIVLNEMNVSGFNLPSLGPIYIVRSDVEINKCNFTQNSVGMLRFNL